MAVAQLLPRLSARRRRHAGLDSLVDDGRNEFCAASKSATRGTGLAPLPFRSPGLRDEKRSAPTVSRLLEQSCTTVLHLVWLRRHL
jgi:hypothetical protein